MAGSANKGKVVAGVFIGMVLGITAAVGIAWYVLKKNPSSFTSREPAKPAVAAPVVTAPPAVSAPVATAPQEKPHFEFYKVLTDKSDGGTHKPTVKKMEPTQVAKVNPAVTPPTATTGTLYYVQVGSFQNPDDAEKLKAKLAFDGIEALIQTATIPDKGVWHRVRIGPMASAEAGQTITSLRQKGIVATQLRAQ